MGEARERGRDRERERKKRDRVFPRRSGKSSAVDVENGNPVIVSSNRPRFLGSLKIFLTFISIDFQHRSQTFLFFSSSSSRRNNKIVTMNLLSLSKERERNSLVPTRSKLMYKIIMMFSIIVFFDIYIYIYNTWTFFPLSSSLPSSSNVSRYSDANSPRSITNLSWGPVQPALKLNRSRASKVFGRVSAANDDKLGRMVRERSG